MLRHCVTFTSNIKYDCDWRRWSSFLAQCWQGCKEQDLYMQDLSNQSKVEMLIAYGHYCLREHRVDNPLAASTIAGSFSGIRHSFRSNALDTDFFDHRSLRAFKTACMLEERKNDAHNKVSKRKYPMTLCMVQKITDAARDGTIGQRMCATAIQLAFFCLLRVSEYVPDNAKIKRGSCHAMLAKDVLFEVQQADGSLKMVDAINIRAWMWPRVTLVKFTLRSMKNDQLRIGSTFWFRNMPGETGINIVQVAFDWAVTAELAAEDYFMSYRRQNRSTWLHYETVNKTIKMRAWLDGFNMSDYGTHSPRIGGACTLRAGDAPETMVNLLGKWRGDTSSWVYQETSMKEFDRMQRIIRNPNLFTIQDINLSYEKSQRTCHSFLAGQRGGAARR